MAIFNLVDQSSQYGSYHHNNVNKFIHIVFVPLILITALVFINNLPHSVLLEYILFPLNGISGGYIPYALSTPLAIALSLYYCILDVKVGLVSMVWIMVGNYLAVYSIAEYGIDVATYWAIIIHIISWVSQFIGHGIFEKRRPALLDNLLQVFIAPFFVTLEVIFGLGFLNNTRVEVEHNVKQKIKAFSEVKGKKIQ